MCRSMLDAGVKSFYTKKDGQQFYYDFASEEYVRSQIRRES